MSKDLLIWGNSQHVSERRRSVRLWPEISPCPLCGAPSATGRVQGTLKSPVLHIYCFSYSDCISVEYLKLISCNDCSWSVHNANSLFFFFWNLLIVNLNYCFPCNIHMKACGRNWHSLWRTLMFNLNRCQADPSKEIIKLKGVFTPHLWFMSFCAMKRHCWVLTAFRNILHLKMLQRWLSII